MKFLRKLYFRIFNIQKRIDFKITTWEEADKLIKENPNWKIAKEDNGLTYPLVALEITERIIE